MDLKKIDYSQLFLSFTAIAGNVFLLYSVNNLQKAFNNLFYSFSIYILAFSLVLVVLKYTKDPYYKFALIINSIFSLIFVFINPNNYVASFMFFFYLFLIFLKIEKCIDKFVSKVSIAKTLALFFSVILFWFIMNPVYYTNLYKNYVESSNFEKPLKNNLNLIINNVINSSVINEEIEKKRQEIIKQFEAEKEKILKNESIPEEYKKEMLKNLEKQKEEALRTLDKQIKSQLNQEDLSKQVIEQIRKTIKNFLQKQDYVKVFTVFMYFSLIGFLNNLVSFISSLLILIIDSLLVLFSKFKKKKQEI